MLMQSAPALVAAETTTPVTRNPESAETKIAQLESTCVSRAVG